MKHPIIAGVCAAAVILTAAVLFAGAAVAAESKRAVVSQGSSRLAECGIASWYGTESGNRTANGEPFTGRGVTAAHRTLPFNTQVRVTDQVTGRRILVRINDRGPFIRGRVIDLSSEAAETFQLKGRGVARVCLEVVE